MRGIFKLARNERGATAVEYGLIVALVVLGMIGGLGLFGNSSTSMWGNVSDRVDSASRR